MKGLVKTLKKQNIKEENTMAKEITLTDCDDSCYAIQSSKQHHKKEVKNVLEYITGIFPEWIDSESRIGFAIEFDPKMFEDVEFFPEGCKKKGGYTKYKESFFEYHDNPWFWLDPEGDIVDYVEDLGELNLEDSLQLPMEAPSEAWRAMIKELEPLLRKALLRFCCNITICPKTLREFVGEFDFDVYKTKDVDGDVVYRLIDLQKANLGGIESDEFADIESITDRLDIYYQDYFLSDIEFILDDIGLRVDNKDILDKWYTLSSYEDMYQYLIDIQKKYCQGDYCPQDLSWSVECLYYIIHPNELADDVEVKD